MNKQEFKKFVDSKVVILDGATGSNLQNKGMTSGVCPEKWILNNKEALIELQFEYLKAGTDILYAPTFTANRIKLKEYGLEDKIKEYNHELVKLSKEAISRYELWNTNNSKRRVLIAGDLTMTGEQLYPFGKLRFEELIDVYKEQISYLVEAGVDLLILETMMSLQECRAAVLAAKETCDLPIMVTLTFGDDNRTLYGTDPETAVIVLQSLGVDAIGVNCSTGPEKMCDILKLMKEYAKVPLIAKPNAGLPKLVGGNTVFDMEAEEFAEKSKDLINAGANMVGGCCGTTPEHIKLLAEAAKNFTPIKIEDKIVRALTTERKTLHLDLDGRFMVIGERINPTGKKALQAELKEGVLDIVSTMATEQVELGADILDINMGMNGINEKEMMLQVIDEVLGLVDVPLSIDSSHVDVIEAALRIYPGRALINSISLEKHKFEQLIPIAKKYGAMFILLPLSDAGLPKDINEKKQIILTILEEAKRHGLSKEDIIVDGLVNTVGANKRAAIDTFETIRFCKNELGLGTVVGLSNISFGLPERQFVNSTFLAMAIQAGLTMAIANPSQDLLMNTAFASDLLMYKEEADIRYIDRVTSRPVEFVSANKLSENKNASEKNLTDRNTSLDGNASMNKSTTNSDNSSMGNSMDRLSSDSTSQNATTKLEENDIYIAVLKGNRRKILDLVKASLEKGFSASEILDDMLIPAINEVGRLFDIQSYYLPQLISSAETMKIAIDHLEPMLKTGTDGQKRGVIVIATVAGDIHDIGKNLVALMLKNYGFEVIDLGKDVNSEIIIQTAKEKDADIIALSALMTTTMQNMKEVVKLRDAEGLRAKVIIGGAVITQSYCDEIHADGYSKDAGEAVVLVKQLLNL